MSKVLLGGDWTELAERWGFDMEEDDEILLQQSVKHMLSSLGEEKTRIAVSNDIREYLRGLIKASDGLPDQSIWLGLLNVPDDEAGQETLIKYTVELLDCMWT